MLQDQMFLDVFREMEELQMDRWANSPVYDYDERQEAYTKLTAIREVMAHIVGMADDRKIIKSRWKILWFTTEQPVFSLTPWGAALMEVDFPLKPTKGLHNDYRHQPEWEWRKHWHY